MGGSNSKTVVETNIVNESTFNALNRSENVVSATVLNVQDMSVKGVKAYGCNLKIGQKINADIKIMQSFNQEDTQNLVNDIMNELDEKVTNESKRKTGFMGISGFDNKKSEAKTNITNKIKKSITNETINKLQGQVVNKQKLVTENLVIDKCGMSVYKELGFPPPVEVVELCTKSLGDCVIDQNVVVKYVAEQLGNKISKIINEDKTAQALSKELTASSTQEAAGIEAAIGAFTGPMKYAIIACALVVVILIVGGVVFSMSPAGQNAAKAAASKIK
mgnify:CR=1 FL=1|jgi:hypothetical protein